MKPSFAVKKNIKLKALCGSRFRSDLDTRDSFGSDTDVLLRGNLAFSDDASGSVVRRRWEKNKGSLGLFRIGQSLKFKSLSSEDPKAGTTKTSTCLDPASLFLRRWNTFFVASRLVAVSVDPLFYYLPIINDANHCITIAPGLKTSVTVLRTMTDCIYMIHMFLQFRTAYIRRSSRVFGRGDLVTDPRKIAAHYLRKDFWLDLLAVLPIPQVRV